MECSVQKGINTWYEFYFLYPILTFIACSTIPMLLKLIQLIYILFEHIYKLYISKLYLLLYMDFDWSPSHWESLLWGWQYSEELCCLDFWCNLCFCVGICISEIRPLLNFYLGHLYSLSWSVYSVRERLGCDRIVGWSPLLDCSSKHQVLSLILSWKQNILSNNNHHSKLNPRWKQ